MTTNQNTQTDLESRLKEMEEENELLLLQLHQVQEELEHYYLKNQELEKAQPVATSASTHAQGWVDDELPEVLAENRRLRALAEVQQQLHQIETQNALNARLGNMLIEAADAGALMSVPGKLMKIWRQSSRQEPPAALGGKTFDKVIAAYNEDGFGAVEKLMAEAAVWPVMQANGYTALARHLMKTDRANAAEAARRAHALDPKPYRLKWLAFRLHEAGNVIEAEAMLDLLPADTPFSESETRQANQLRYEAKNARQREAKQQTAYAERRAAVERQLRALTQEKDTQANLAAERRREVEALKQANAELKQEVERHKQGETQSKEENELLLRQLHEVQEELERAYLDKEQLENEYAATAGRLNENAGVVADLQATIAQLTETNQAREVELLRQIDALQRTQARLEDEKSALVRWHDEAVELAEELNRELEVQQQAHEQFEQQQELLAARFEEQAALAVERQAQIEQLTRMNAAKEAELIGEIETLRQLQARTEQEKSAVVKWHDELVVLADERNRQIEALQHAQAHFQQIHTALTERYDEQVKRTAELTAQIERLTHEHGTREADLNREIDALRLLGERLEHERSALVSRYEEQAALTAEQCASIEQLAQAADAREAEIARQVEALRQQQEKFDREILALAAQAEQAEKLAAERLNKINELQKQHEHRHAGEAELATRQQLMHEEMVRAEAQLDLIKDILLREPGL